MSINYNSNQTARILRIVAMAIILISAIFFMFFGLLTKLNQGLGLGGILFGMAVPGLIFLIGAIIAWYWGLIGGIALILLGLFAFFLYSAMLGYEILAFIYALPSSLPPLAAGSLFIVSWVKGRK